MLYTLVDGFQQAVKRGPPITDPKALGGFLDALVNKDAVDDRKGVVSIFFGGIVETTFGRSLTSNYAQIS